MDRSDLPADLARVAARVEIERIANLTALDDLGVHVAAAIRRPLDAASISVCSGRGATWEEARRAAIAEAVERYCAEPRGRLPVRTAVRPTGARIDIASLVPATAPGLGEQLEWIRGARILDGEPVWIPAVAVFFPYPPARWLGPATHGLAAGESIDDATRRALLECIERDAYTRAIAIASAGRDVCPAIEPRLLSPAARSLHAQLERRGLRVVLRDVTGPTGVPVALATIAEDAWAHRGCAADGDLARAAERALAEAVQGRLVDIQGAREDLPAERRAPDDWFLHPASTLSRMPEPIATDVAGLARRLIADGCEPPALVDLSLEDCPWRVVRVVVPGLEVWADDPSRAGDRLEAWCRGA